MTPRRKGPKRYGTERKTWRELTARERAEVLSERAAKGWRTRRRKTKRERGGAEPREVRRKQLRELEPERLTDAEVEELEREAMQDEADELPPLPPELPAEPRIFAEGYHTSQGWRDLYPTGSPAFGRDDPEAEAARTSLFDKLAAAWESVPPELRPYSVILLSTDRTAGEPIRFAPTDDPAEVLASLKGQLYHAGFRATPQSPKDLGMASWARWQVRYEPPQVPYTDAELRELEERRTKYAERIRAEGDAPVMPKERARRRKDGTVVGRLSQARTNVKRRERYSDPAFREEYNRKRREREARKRPKRES